MRLVRVNERVSLWHCASKVLLEVQGGGVLAIWEADVEAMHKPSNAHVHKLDTKQCPQAHTTPNIERQELIVGAFHVNFRVPDEPVAVEPLGVWAITIRPVASHTCSRTSVC